MNADWTPVILALAAAIPILVTAIASYIQVRANSTAIKKVHQAVNGGNTSLSNRMTSIEHAEAIHHPDDIKGE